MAHPRRIAVTVEMIGHGTTDQNLSGLGLLLKFMRDIHGLTQSHILHASFMPDAADHGQTLVNANSHVQSPVRIRWKIMIDGIKSRQNSLRTAQSLLRLGAGLRV